MLKIITMLTAISFTVLNATEYKLEINKANYDKNILVKEYIAPNLVCELPKVLNEEKTNCEIPIPICISPEILNEEQNQCFNPIEAVGWIYTGDTCNGMRQMNFNPNVYVARANKSIIDTTLQIPEGYHWITKSEFTNLFNESLVSSKSSAIYNYYGHCGHSQYPKMDSKNVYGILFKGSTGGAHAGQYEYQAAASGTNNYYYPNNFLGYFLYKD
jgi:hypothetical protein